MQNAMDRGLSDPNRVQKECNNSNHMHISLGENPTKIQQDLLLEDMNQIEVRSYKNCSESKTH